MGHIQIGKNQEIFVTRKGVRYNFEVAKPLGTLQEEDLKVYLCECGKKIYYRFDGACDNCKCSYERLEDLLYGNPYGDNALLIQQFNKHFQGRFVLKEVVVGNHLKFELQRLH